MTRPMLWDKWFFTDLDRDCGALSLAARGAWVWIIGDLRNHGGERSLTLQGWAQVIRATVEQTAEVLSELIREKICDSSVISSVTDNGLLTEEYRSNNDQITLKCRRIARESKERAQNNIRQRRFQHKRKSNAPDDAPVTPLSRFCNAGDAEKQEAEKLETPCSPPREATQNNGNGHEPFSLESLFLILWGSFPEHRRKKRPLALRKFLSLRPSKRLLDERILPALDKLKESEEWTRENGRFVPGLVNWIEDRGWESVKLDEVCTACKRTGVIVRTVDGLMLPWTIERECKQGLKPEVCPDCKGRDRVSVPGLPQIKFPDL